MKGESEKRIQQFLYASMFNDHMYVIFSSMKFYILLLLFGQVCYVCQMNATPCSFCPLHCSINLGVMHVVSLFLLNSVI